MISRNFNQRITQGKKKIMKIILSSSSLWGNKKQKGTTQIIASQLKSTVVNNEIKLERIEIWFRNDATPQSEKKAQPLFIPHKITHWNTATLTNEFY